MTLEMLRLPKPRASTRAAKGVGAVAVFHTPLGWIALATRDESLVRLVFGHRTARAAREALAAASKKPSVVATTHSTNGSFAESLKNRLEAYAEGQPDDFTDVRVWSERWTPFQRRVLDRCRRIPYGQTRSYGELAVAAGSPGAARAVGRTMATNPIPLVIPCHRVVGSGGDLCGFSAVGGLDAKRWLLDLEQGVAVR